MTGEELIKEIQDQAGEWLEIVECPATFVAGVLANKIINLQNHIQYLERRLHYDNLSRNIRAGAGQLRMAPIKKNQDNGNRCPRDNEGISLENTPSIVSWKDFK